MPYIWGEFESSLRGSKISADDLKKVLHKTCSGHAHGHGVPKESFLLTRIRALKINNNKKILNKTRAKVFQKNVRQVCTRIRRSESEKNHATSP